MQNNLASEKSPYLKQHAHNPVWWQAWGPHAFQTARENGRLIFLSIGYSTCHWCHVMEREVFEDQECADLLNEHYISIKVDREEMPDVDHIYMEALHMMGSRGGWPLTMILTPELKPIFGGTYFPKHNFLKLATGIAQTWKADRETVEKRTAEIFSEIQRILNDRGNRGAATQPSAGAGHDSKALFQKVRAQSLERYDEMWGGFGGAPKFPPNFLLSFLMSSETPHEERSSSVELATGTLLGMSRGGLFDHIDGGFARYSVDPEWTIPHFEKMLYNQAQNLENLVDAAKVEAVKPDPRNRDELNYYADRTVTYVLDQMTHTEGGFFSAEDADSEGHEGKFYVWTHEELNSILGAEGFSILASVFDLSADGNFEEGTIHLRVRPDRPPHISFPGWFSGPIPNLLQKLSVVRAKRVRPLRDEKILTSWNGLMISALAKYAGASENAVSLRARSAAVKGGEFILKNLTSGDQLYRRWIDGERLHNGTLEDYAFFIRACLDLHELTFENRWLEAAVQFQGRLDADFWDGSGYFFSAKSEQYLILRTQDFTDNATPSGNGIAAMNGLRLYALGFGNSFRERARTLINEGITTAAQYPSAGGTMLLSLDAETRGHLEIVVSTNSNESFVSQLKRRDMPPYVLTTANSLAPVAQGKTGELIWICREGACDRPRTETEAIAWLQDLC